MASKKPKPATAGEKIVMRWGYTLAMCRHDGFYKMRAADVDRACAHAGRFASAASACPSSITKSWLPWNE